ncbi:hypothetical protein EAI_02944 [Harpegnathos saltator]|uniref:Uncharacterized protein n=1 Tax=Harpegnathos saltator TaxID=610380 RepID=E2BCY7_HARSA|nr:hypothetical protein EAI_02944 [Harpegnathos saltator]
MAFIAEVVTMRHPTGVGPHNNCLHMESIDVTKFWKNSVESCSDSNLGPLAVESNRLTTVRYCCSLVETVFTTYSYNRERANILRKELSRLRGVKSIVLAKQNYEYRGNMDVIIEVQCFRDSNDVYVLKEVAIVGINEAFVGHWILAPEYSFAELNEKSRRINNWLSLNYHGIEWEVQSEIFYPRLREITSHIRDFMTRGKEKASYLQNLLARNVYNLENISPTSSDLSSNERVEDCSFHAFRKHRRYHCALRNAYKLKH